METNPSRGKDDGKKRGRNLNILYAQEEIFIAIGPKGGRRHRRKSFVIEYFNKITFFGEMAMLYASVSSFWGNLLLRS